MLRVLQGISLIAATMTAGMMAGVFALFFHTVMPGLGRTDDRTFVGAFQAIDRAIINGWFMVTFLGALLFSGLAAALNLTEDQRQVLPWVVAAVVGYLVTFVITIAINVPLNDAIKAAGDPDQIADLAGVRSHFDEGRWAAWNLVRTVTSTVAFGCLAWALVQFGRAVEAAGA